MQTRTVIIIAAAMLAIATLASALAGLRFEPLSVLRVLAAAAGLYVAAFVFVRLRPRPAFAATLAGTASLLVGTLALGCISYASTAMNRPLIDASLAAMDRALGFDWPAFVAACNSLPLLRAILAVTYQTSALQMLAVVLILGLGGQIVRLNRFLALYMLTGLVTVVLAGLLPAIGAYAHHMPMQDVTAMESFAGISHLAHFNALRAGTLPMISVDAFDGLATFPSFHTVLAVLVAWAMWPMRILRWPAIALNAAVIVSTLPEGGHHMVDLIGGGAIAAIGIGATWMRAPATDQTPALHLARAG